MEITDFFTTTLIPSDTYVSYDDAFEHMTVEKVPYISTFDVEDVSEYDNRTYIITCDDEQELSQNNILVTLARIKAKFIFKEHTVRIKKITCEMTPAVKDNILFAYRKLKMYGKDLPVVMGFDEHFNLLPDKLKLGEVCGIDIRIVNISEDYEKNYICFKGDLATFDKYR